MDNRAWPSRFAAAGRGVAVAWRQEPHLRFHGVAAALVCCVAGAGGLSAGEWLWLLLTITAVLLAETGNAALERSVDLAGNGKLHPLARDAKDMAAGAVLLAALQSVVGGSYVFLWQRGPWVLLHALWTWPLRTPWAWAAYTAAALIALAAAFGGDDRR